MGVGGLKTDPGWVKKMVVVHRFGPYRVAIFSNDHAPAHVHVIGAGGEAKVQLVGPDAPTVIRHRGLDAADLRRIVTEIVAEMPKLLQWWLELHGSEDGRSTGRKL